jgi:hypothetical protein
MDDDIFDSEVDQKQIEKVLMENEHNKRQEKMSRVIFILM